MGGGAAVEELANPVAPGMFWSAVFGAGTASGRVTRLVKEVQAMKMIERVQLGELSFAQYERMTAFLEAERLGQANKVIRLGLDGLASGRPKSSGWHLLTLKS